MTSDSEPILPVILCGGAGTRLWPLSHPARPKPLLALGEGGETLLGGTLARFADAGLYAPPTIVAGEEQGEAIAAEIRKSRIAEPMLILEPAARNTAPAIALAALAAEPGALLLVAPSDHVIARPQALHEAVRRARPFAAQGRLVAFGIAPDRPATGYGYVKAGAKLGDGVLEADAFVEKPDAGTAKKWLAQGGYYWNAGLFLMRADACLAALDLHAPEVAAEARQAMAGAARDGDRVRPAPEAFARAPSISIDHAVMEKADKVAVAPVEMGWSDLGSFDALYELAAKDDDGNALAGEAIAIGSRNCLLRGEGARVVALGVEDLIVVAAGRDVLIVPRGQSQKVREAAKEMEKKGGDG